MTTNPTAPAIAEPPAGVSLNDYQLRLPGFEGPLDVLLRLIEREQLPIAELSLVQVTGQFLAAVRSLDARVPPIVIADFAAIGTRLTLLKSRSLLPRPPTPDEDSDPGDLVQQLLRYREIRDAARHLAARDVVDHAVFPAAGRAVIGAEAATVRLADYAPAVLVRALRRRLTQVVEPARLFAGIRTVSLREMVGRLAGRLAGSRSVAFSDVAAQCRDRIEVQTAFLAGLVLIRRDLADARQDELFGEITFRGLARSDGEYLTGLAGDVTADFEATPDPDDEPAAWRATA